MDRTLSMICPVHASAQAFLLGEVGKSQGENVGLKTGKPQCFPMGLSVFFTMLPQRSLWRSIRAEGFCEPSIFAPRHCQTFGQSRLLGTNLKVKAGSVGGVRSNEIHLQCEGLSLASGVSAGKQHRNVVEPNAPPSQISAMSVFTQVEPILLALLASHCEYLATLRLPLSLSLL